MTVVINNNTELQTIAEQTKTTRNNISTVVARARPSLPTVIIKREVSPDLIVRETSVSESTPLAPRCCHVANDLTNFTGDRQTNKQRNRWTAPSRKGPAVAGEAYNIWSEFC